MLKDKTVVLGITGSIAAYKMASVASSLRKLGVNVEVIMTCNATQFITPVTFEATQEVQIYVFNVFFQKKRGAKARPEKITF